MRHRPVLSPTRPIGQPHPMSVRAAGSSGSKSEHDCSIPLRRAFSITLFSTYRREGSLQLTCIEVISADPVVELTMSFWWFFECCSAVEQVKQLTEEESILPVPIPSCNAYITYMLSRTPFMLPVRKWSRQFSLILEGGSFSADRLLAAKLCTNKYT